jgi:hypothetical protein
MDNVQKQNNCINTPLSQLNRSFCISRKQAEEGPTWIYTDHTHLYTDTSKISYNCEIGFKIFLGTALLVT